jgi:hypothetical protein
MRTAHAHIPHFAAGWRNAAAANGVVVRPRVMGFVPSVTVDSITRQADRKPRPSGFEPRRAAP